MGKPGATLQKKEGENETLPRLFRVMHPPVIIQFLELGLFINLLFADISPSRTRSKTPLHSTLERRLILTAYWRRTLIIRKAHFSMRK